ncbi:MAG: DUF1853 family protein [Gammaproteobacteria bacterium]
MRNPLAALERYQSPLVKDLVWAILSPTLINSNNANHNPSARWYLEAFRLIESHLQTLDQNDDPLQEHLTAPPNHRLGLYFERLWSYWLQHNGRYRMLAHNLQVMHDQQTLGEFDFIVHDSAADQIEHWELAVKFYLGIPPLDDMQHWFGANTQDRLDLKYHHLIHKQLTLSETRPGRMACTEHGWHISQRRLISKGRLYYPWPPATQLPPPPVCIDPPHLHGFWLPLTAFKQEAVRHSDARYHWLEKTEWLVHRSAPALDLQAVTALLEQQQRPHPIQLHIDGWLPTPIRLFIVPDNWAESALQTLSPRRQ